MRSVRSQPRSSLTELPSERPHINWERDLEGEEFSIDEPVADDESTCSDSCNYSDNYEYSDDFEEITDDDEQETSTPTTEFRIIQINGRFKPMVPNDDRTKFDFQIEPMTAESRTQLLSTFKHHGDEIMISDTYEVTGELPDREKEKWVLILPVVLPTTRLSLEDLFRFHVVGMGRSGEWREIEAEYDKHELKFPFKDLKFFVAYARPIPEFTNITSRGFTFVSSKDKRIKVQIPKGAVNNEMTMKVEVHPIDTTRLTWFREYDPTAFEGIYALTDILSVRHTMENVFQRTASVTLPISPMAKGYRLKCLTGELGICRIVNIDRESVRNGEIEIPYTGENNMSFQATYVGPKVTKKKITEYSKYQTGLLDICTILMFLSKKNNNCFLTVEIVEAPKAEVTAQNRSKRGFYEIQNSRYRDLRIEKNTRIRIDLGGNMQSADLHKNTKYTIQFCSSCRNNSIEFRTQKNCNGTHYSIATVLIGGHIIHEVHFYYPEKGMNLKEIKNLCTSNTVFKINPKPRTHVDKRRASITDSDASSDTGYNTVRTDSLGITSREESHSDDTSNQRAPQRNDTANTKGHECNEDALNTDNAYHVHSGKGKRRIYSSAHASHSEQSQRRGAYSDRPCTDVSSEQYQVHPLLEMDSLLILGMNLPPTVVNHILIMARVNSHKIEEIRNDAKVNRFDENMCLLKKWLILKRREFSNDNEILQSLEYVLNDMERYDIAQIIERLRKKKIPRRFKTKDFNDL